MAFVQARCLNCGGILAVDNANDAFICPFCNTPHVLQKAVQCFSETVKMNGKNVNVGTINAQNVNINMTANKDFEIIGGVLKKYIGSSTEVVVPDEVKIIGSGAFDRCSAITSVKLPNGLLEIGTGAFANCTRLKTINIPDTVTSIGFQAFSGCTSLSSITIPDSVRNIESFAFWECPNLKSIKYSHLFEEKNYMVFSIFADR